MIEALRSWLIAVAAAAFLVSLSQSLIPEGTVRKIAGFAGGLTLLLVMVRPLLGADFDHLDFHYEDYAGEISQRQTELQTQSDQTLQELIAEKTEAYILDKAAALGVDCTVHVLMSPLKVLSRGYAVARNEQGIIKSYQNAPAGSRIEVTLGEGTLDCTVEKGRP